MKIFLIGFMASGKSTIGKQLAEKLSVPFIDLDEWIEKCEGRSVTLIFAESGEPVFRQIESAYLKKLEGTKTAIIATGGGTPCFFDNMDWMKQNGLTLYLRTDPFILFERLKASDRERPLLSGRKDQALLDFIKNTIEKRAVFYENAHLIFEQNEMTDNPAAEIFNYISHFLPYKT